MTRQTRLPSPFMRAVAVLLVAALLPTGMVPLARVQGAEPTRATAAATPPRGYVQRAELERFANEIQELRSEFRAQLSEMRQQFSLELKAQLALLAPPEATAKIRTELGKQVEGLEQDLRQRLEGVAASDPELSSLVDRLLSQEGGVARLRGLTKDSAKGAVDQAVQSAAKDLEGLRTLVQQRAETFATHLNRLPPEVLKFSEERLRGYVQQRGAQGREALLATARKLLKPGQDASVLADLDADGLVRWIGARAEDGQWGAALIASLPPEVLPPELGPYVEGARKVFEAQTTEEAVAALTDTALQLAIMTGNPYVIAAAAILKLLSLILGGGGGGGGSGKGSGKRGEGPGRTPGTGNVEATNPGDPSPQPQGPSTPPHGGAGRAAGPIVKPGLGATVEFIGDEVVFTSTDRLKEFRVKRGGEVSFGARGLNAPPPRQVHIDWPNTTVNVVDFPSRSARVETALAGGARELYLLSVPEPGSPDPPTLVIEPR